MPSFEADSFRRLKTFLVQEREAGKQIFPPASRIFAALDLTPWDKVKVVILGQDPYHGPGQAHGLSFSVQDGQPHPPSLQNIFKELTSDVGVPRPTSGDLTPWAQQGVLLLNATLTVEAHRAGSHQNRGWETFTDSIVQLLAHEKEGLVFILWGRYARAKEKMIDPKKHAVVASAHPSPLSAHGGFFGSRPFSKTNQHLQTFGSDPIDWSLAP